jgi:hypothetical protein
MWGGREKVGIEETREWMIAGVTGATTIAGIGAEVEEEDEDEGERHRLWRLLLALMRARLKASPHFSQWCWERDKRQATDQDRTKQTKQKRVSKCRQLVQFTCVCWCVLDHSLPYRRFEKRKHELHPPPFWEKEEGRGSHEKWLSACKSGKVSKSTFKIDKNKNIILIRCNNTSKH